MGLATPVERRRDAPRWSVLAVTAAAAFVVFLDASIVYVAFPDVEQAFPGSSRGTLAWVITGYNVVLAAFLLPAGRIADARGRRRCFLLGMTIFAAASAACGLAPSVDVLIASRVVQAAGAALLLPAALGLLMPLFGRHQLATAIGVWSAAGGVAVAAGPTLGGALVELADWRWIFLVNVPIAAVLLVAARRIIPDVAAPGGRLPDVVGATVLAVGMGGLAFGLTKAEAWGWTDPAVLGCLAGALALVAAVVARSVGHASPVVSVALYRIRPFAAANAGTLLFATGFYGLLLSQVLYLTSGWSYSVLEAGLAITPTPVAAAAAAPLAGRLADRFGPRAVAVPGTLAFALGTVWLAARVGPSPDLLGAWLPGTIACGIGVGAALPIFGTAAVASVPAQHVAEAASASMASRQVGGVLGVSLLVTIVAAAVPELPGDYVAAWIVFAAAGGAAVLPALVLPSAIGARPPEWAVQESNLQPWD